MANVDNTLLNKNPLNVGIDKENQIQGLFFDLLACLGGGDSSTLPANYAQKPMTGFCEILDAFNEVIKIHESGSGTVCEVSSSDLTNQDSFEGISSESNGSLNLKPVASQQLCSTSNSTLCSTDCENGTAQEPTFQPVLEEVGQPGASTSPQKVEVSETDEFHDTLDTLDRTEMPANGLNASSDENNNTNLLEIPCQSQNESVLPQEIFQVCNPFNPDLVEEIGPPLNLTPSLVSLMSQHQSDLPPDIAALERDIYLYSDEIREVERILREHVIPPNTGLSNPSILIGSGVVESISDGLLMSPRSGLQMMYDNESMGSSRQPNSTYLSTYQSCTSFDTCPNYPECNASNPLSLRVNEQTPSSIYMDCLNIAHSDSADDFFTALESINPSFICAGTEQISERPVEGIIVPDQSNLGQVDTVIYQSMPCTQAVGEEKHGEEEPDMVSVSAEKSNSKTSVDPTSNSEVDSMTDGEDSNISLGKKNKRKSGYKTASSEEHLWTSASPSDFEDVENTVGEQLLSNFGS